MSRANVQKRKKIPHMEIAPENDHKRKIHVTMTEKGAYTSKKLELQNQSLASLH